MSREDVYTALAATGIPTAHMCFPEESAPSLPFCVFYTDEDSSLNAGDSRYVESQQWTVELYEQYADETTEALVEAAIEALGNYTKTEQWVPDEKCLMVAYYFKQTKGYGNG